MKLRRISGPLLAVLALVASVASTPAIAAGSEGAATASAKVRVKVLTQGQSKILKRDAIKVRAKGLHRELRLRARSKTFDSQTFKNLTKRAVLRPGKPTAKLRLNGRGAEQVSSCTSREVTISGKRAKVSFDLRRNSSTSAGRSRST